MTDLNALLKDWKDKRLSYNEVNRASLEALFTGIVDELEALKAKVNLPAGTGVFIADNVPVFSIETQPAKRGPGRPPKAEAA